MSTSPAPEFRVFPDAAAVARAAADVFAAAAADAVSKRGRFCVALAGGNTPRALHAHLAAGGAGALPWAKTFIFFGDERCVPPDDPASNYRMAKETLLSLVPVPSTQVFRIPGYAADRDKAARRYEEILRRETAKGGGLDLVFLGVGEDGHTASLFPGSPALLEETRLVVATQAPLNVKPRDRITLTLPALAAARLVVFLTAGANKRAALSRVRAGGPEAPPAALVRAREEVIFLVDTEAAGAIARGAALG